ncbi:MAG: metal ABC transporter substrate-binding protein [Gammaproteobacteria bacterium]|nr:metal ABC transporter substrate-binding protein [Gammaproteobacteria bacterium]
MKLLYKLLVGLIISISSSNASAVIRIEASTQDLAAIAKSVGAQYVNSNSLTLGTRDPHYAVAKPSMIRRVHQADLILLVGADLEIGWLPLLLKSARNSRVLPGNNGYLDLSDSVRLMDVATGSVSREMGDVHEKGNPHYWLDPRNGSKIAQAIAKRLSLIEPAHAAEFKANADAFSNTLNSKYAEWKKALQGLKGKPVITYHNSLLYLAAAFDFTIAAQVEPKPGIAPSAASLASLLDIIKKQNISLLLKEPYYEQRSSDYLQQHGGIKTVVIPQSVGAKEGIDNYFDLFDKIVMALTKEG